MSIHASSGLALKLFRKVRSPASAVLNTICV
jgi:hypothetical protein